MIFRTARHSAALLAVLTGIACDSPRTTSPEIEHVSAIKRDVVSQVYTSGTQVMTWDAIPETVQPADWTPYCTNTPKYGRNANWQNPHNAFVVWHPWQDDYFSAPWINAWSTNQSSGGNPVSPHYNWTKYTTPVEGNGSFVIRLLADNCSWIYLDGTLVGVQGTVLSANSYGLTLNGTHTLEFIIFDGGGASGGKYILETTTNPPAPLNNDLDGDGHLNTADAFPLDPTRWAPDAGADSDGDGVVDSLDAFPTNPAEWADTDSDGVGNNADPYDNSNTGPFLMVSTCNTGVANWNMGGGTWANDLIAAAYSSAANHGKFVTAVQSLADGWKKSGRITGKEHGAIVSCAARSK